jgi:hypothetical protein
VFFHHGHEGWWSTESDQSVWAWLWHLFLEHFLGDEADSLFPAYGIVRLDVDRAVEVKSVLELLSHLE